MKSRGSKGLATRYRPMLFSEVIGHEKILRGIQEKWESEKRPLAWLFSGETGTGKTTLARIMAVSVNCKHQDEFGEPCARCRKIKNQFNILEINASDITGIDKIREVIASYTYTPQPPSRMRVFILDEAQRLSDAAQNLLLKPFEDGPTTTLWIICTTNPQKILPTLRGRCTLEHLKSFGPKNIEKLVREIIQSERDNGFYLDKLPDKDIEKFVGNLIEQRIRTPRNILSQLERFMAEKDPSVVIQVNQVGDVRLGRLVWEGNWNAVRKDIFELTDEELNGLRYSLISYFRTILRKEGKGATARKMVQAIEILASAGSYDERMTGHKVIAGVYKLCELFGPKSR